MDQKRLKKIPEQPDVRVQIGGRMFPCHRHILGSHSRYFEALFACNFKDARKDTISLPRKYVHKESFSILLDAIYEEEYSITGHNVLSVFVASSYLDYEYLLDKCARYIIENLENIIDPVPLIALPQLMDRPWLHAAVFKYSCRNFPEVFQRSKVVPFHVLESLLRQKELLIFRAVPALKFCNAWLKECRIDHYREAIACQLIPYLMYRSSEVVAQCEQYMRENFSVEDMLELFVGFQNSETEDQPCYKFAKSCLRQNFFKIDARKLMEISFLRLHDLIGDPSLFDLDACATSVLQFTKEWASYRGGNNPARKKFQCELSRLQEPFARHQSIMRLWKHVIHSLFPAKVITMYASCCST